MSNEIDLFILYGSCGGCIEESFSTHSIESRPPSTAIYGILRHLSDEHSDAKTVPIEKTYLNDSNGQKKKTTAEAAAETHERVLYSIMTCRQRCCWCQYYRFKLTTTTMASAASSTFESIQTANSTSNVHTQNILNGIDFWANRNRFVI